MSLLAIMMPFFLMILCVDAGNLQSRGIRKVSAEHPLKSLSQLVLAMHRIPQSIPQGSKMTKRMFELRSTMNVDTEDEVIVDTGDEVTGDSQVKSSPTPISGFSEDEELARIEAELYDEDEEIEELESMFGDLTEEEIMEFSGMTGEELQEAAKAADEPEPENDSISYDTLKDAMSFAVIELPANFSQNLLVPEMRIGQWEQRLKRAGVELPKSLAEIIDSMPANPGGREVDFIDTTASRSRFKADLLSDPKARVRSLMNEVLAMKEIKESMTPEDYAKVFDRNVMGLEKELGIADESGLGG